MRIVSIVGARPQFVKLAMLARALERAAAAGEPIEHVIVHTGQHYDASLSGVFFEELGIPRPDHDLGAGSGSHGVQTGEMLKRLEPVLAAAAPDWVLLYGDTNSTLAGALVAAKAGFPVAHIEAGLRSHRRAMAEEVNRVVADHLSDLLFCPTPLAMDNLRREGLDDRAVLSGDVMLDACMAFRHRAEERANGSAHHWQPRSFALATVHRAENTDDPARLASIVKALDHIARTICPVLWPVHPRTRKQLTALGCEATAVTTIAPVSYLDMLLLEGRARFILTDSGGVQKEAYFMRVPCVTLRDETEWRETLAHHCNTLTGCDEAAITAAAAQTGRAGPWSVDYGRGDAAGIMVNALRGRRVAP